MINRRRIASDRTRLAVTASSVRASAVLSPGNLYVLANFLACLWMLALGLRVAALVFAMSALAGLACQMRWHS